MTGSVRKTGTLLAREMFLFSLSGEIKNWGSKDDKHML